VKITYPARIFAGRAVPLPAHVGPVAAKLAKFKGDEVVHVTIESERKTRTLSQNARMWTLLSVFEEWGWHKDEAKVWCCGEFLPPLVREMPDGSRIETKASRTSGLTTEQMSAFMDRIEHFLIEQGVHIPADES